MPLNLTFIAGGGQWSRRAYCGIQAPTGDVYCWDTGQASIIGFGTSPTYGVGPYLAFTSVTVGSLGYACGLVASGAAWCWGWGDLGNLGDGVSASHSSPYSGSIAVPVVGGLYFSSLTAGQGHTCGVEAGTGAAWCWGYDDHGQLGINTTSNVYRPTRVSTSVTFTQLAAGARFTVGVAAPPPPRHPGL